MKKLLALSVGVVCISAAGNAQFACSGLDRVDIYLNSRLVGTSTAADAPVIKLDTADKTDTIMLHAYTDWEGLRNSTLDVEDESGELMDHINSTHNTGYEAVFTYIFIRAGLDDPEMKSFDMKINLLCERTIETEQITTVNTGR